ncbi:unnamed protein product [Vitrella brassicaformis CCMP3155]|uniref:Uncharacterized protein n=1 Tax=Vitrella brassicaformis (strain CCMP3155) TaxID=1169540 RepID=A0A0G4H7X2_VITBC|nr:unnamed protein product [Vitrella brassicaformis CCMP3155]|eukprot:CEM39859.1 unnamed protein product [Vitrella brassicaformis CCMP3155]
MHMEWRLKEQISFLCMEKLPEDAETLPPFLKGERKEGGGTECAAALMGPTQPISSATLPDITHHVGAPKVGAYVLSDILEGKPTAKGSPYPSTSSISTDAPHMPTGDIDDIEVPFSKAKTSSWLSIVSIQKLIMSVIGSCKIGPGPAKIDEHEIIL